MPSNEPCPECGARPKGPATDYCTYCGARLAQVPSPAEIARNSREARLAAIERHPDFAAALAHLPDLRAHVASGFMSVGCLVAFTAITGFIALSAMGLTVLGTREFGPGGVAGLPFVIIPGIMCALGLYGAFHQMKVAKAFRDGALERVPAVVRDERTRKGKESSSYYVTLEFVGGKRDEYRVDGELAGRVVPDDVGVAYIKGGHLVDFRRLDV